MCMNVSKRKTFLFMYVFIRTTSIYDVFPWKNSASHNLTTFYYTTTWFKKSKYTVNTTHYSPTAQKHCKGETLDSTNTLLAIYLGWQDYNCNAVQSSNVQSQFAWFLPRSQQFPNKKGTWSVWGRSQFPRGLRTLFPFFRCIASNNWPVMDEVK